MKHISEISTIADAVVKRYIARGIIPIAYGDDICMAMIESFLLKKEAINKNFNHKSKIETYYTAVLNRMCCEQIRKEFKHWKNTEPIDNQINETTSANLPDLDLIIKQEVTLLFNILDQMTIDGKRFKVMLFFYYNVPFLKGIIEHWATEKSLFVYDILNRKEKITKDEVYEKMKDAINYVEEMNKKRDAIRMWFTSRVSILLTILNKDNRAYHTKETIALLLERKK